MLENYYFGVVNSNCDDFIVAIAMRFCEIDSLFKEHQRKVLKRAKSFCERKEYRKKQFFYLNRACSVSKTHKPRNTL